MRSFDIELTAGFCIGAALAILTLPCNVLLSFAVSAAFHELCHLAVLFWYQVPIQRMELGLFGAKITTGVMEPLQELLCAAAGPVGSLMFVLFADRLPLLAVFGLVQGLFNLLPIYPLDGGRVLRSIFMLAKTARWHYNRADI